MSRNENWRHFLVVSQRLLMAVGTRIYTVTVQEIKGNKVYVIREVTKPGQFSVNPRVDVMRALSMAGGTTPFALLNNIVILRRKGTAQTALSFHYMDCGQRQGSGPEHSAGKRGCRGCAISEAPHDGLLVV